MMMMMIMMMMMMMMMTARFVDEDRETYVVLDPPSILELLLEHPEHHPHDKVLVGLSCEKEAVRIPNTEESRAWPTCCAATDHPRTPEHMYEYKKTKFWEAVWGGAKSS